MLSFTLTKQERICRRAEQERLFSRESRSVAAFPIRAIFVLRERKDDEPSVKMMVSVPKRFFKRAVKRNRIKRQLREAYRLRKHHLIEVVENQKDKSLLVAFVWIDNNLVSSRKVNEKMDKLICRISEVLSA